MDDKYDSLVRVVRLKSLNRCGVGELLGIEDTRNFMLFRIGLLKHDRERHSEVGGERNGACIELDGLRGERILERENTSTALEVCDYGDAVKNSRWGKIRTRVFVWLAFHGDDCCTYARARGPFGDVLAVNIEFVSRREVVERRVPLRAWVGLVCKHKVSLRTRYRERLGPWVEFGLVDNLEDAGDRKIVVAGRSGIGRIAAQFTGGGCERIQAMAH